MIPSFAFFLSTTMLFNVAGASASARASARAKAAAAPVGNTVVGDIPAMSSLGQNLLSKGRLLNDVQHEDNQLDWIAGYSLKFEACYDELRIGNNEYDDPNEKSYGDGYQFTTSHYIHFRLCPSESCSSGGCDNGGLYAVGMSDFLSSFLETRIQVEQEMCEEASRVCTNSNRDVSECYNYAGLEYCDFLEEWGNGESFDIQSYMNCAEVERMQNGTDVSSKYFYISPYNCYNAECKFYMAPTCSSDGKGVKFGVFIDDTCSTPAPDGAYDAYNYGSKLPFDNESMVGSLCHSCQTTDNDGSIQVSDMCLELYNSATLKCEENVVDTDTPDNSACIYLQTTLPQLDSLAKQAMANIDIVFWSIVPIAALLMVGAVGLKTKCKSPSSRVNLADQGVGGSTVDGVAAQDAVECALEGAVAA